MATYTELYSLRASDNLVGLSRKIEVAVAIKANTIAKLPTPTAEQRAFAVAALRNPGEYQGLVLNYILAEYNTQAVGVITGATDAQVQTAVGAAVDTLLGA
jgi:hypothetical protein